MPMKTDSEVKFRDAKAKAVAGFFIASIGIALAFLAFGASYLLVTFGVDLALLTMLRRGAGVLFGASIIVLAYPLRAVVDMRTGDRDTAGRKTMPATAARTVTGRTLGFWLKVVTVTGGLAIILFSIFGG